MPPRGARGGQAAPAAVPAVVTVPPPPTGLVLPAWALGGDAGVPVRDSATYLSQYAASSDPLILQDGREAGRRLPLFGAAHVRGSGAGAGAASTSAAAATSTPLPVEAGIAADVVFFAGGPVWALDWCPQVVREGDRVSRFLALSAHPKHRHRNEVGIPISGPALIQVWRLPVGGPGAAKPATPPARRGPPPPPVLSGPAALPRPALALAHGGGLAWDCKWRPTVQGVVSSPAAGAGGTGPAHPPLLGVLAAALGDGTLAVWGVPVPAASPAEPPPAAVVPPAGSGKKRKAPVAAAAAPSPASTATLNPPTLLDLPPAAAGRAGAALPSCIEWCAAHPHDLLAAACWDGSAVLWRVGEWEEEEGGAGGPPASPPPRPWAGERTSSLCFGLSPLLRVQAEPSPLRSIAWPPPPIVTAFRGTPPLTAFATAGHAADLCVWEAASGGPGPRLAVALPREWAFGLAWVPHPLGLLVAQDGGRLTFAPLEAGAASATQAFPLEGHGEAWSVDALRPPLASTGATVAAVGVGAGDVGVFEVKLSAKARVGTGHRVVAGFRRRGGVGAGVAAVEAAPAGGGRGGRGGRGRGRGRGRGGGGEPSSPSPAALPTADRTLVLPSAKALAKDACLYRGPAATGPAARAAAARSALPDEGLAVTRVRWAVGSGEAGGGADDWAWLASAGGGGVVRCQLVDVRGCGA